MVSSCVAIRGRARQALSVLALLALTGCAHAMLAGKPTETCPSGVRVWSSAALCPDIESVVRAGLAVCPAAKLPALHAALAAVEVRTCQPPCLLECQRAAHGCAQPTGGVFVESAAAIPDELAHVIWTACSGRSGEAADADGGVSYDPDFAAFLSGAR